MTKIDFRSDTVTVPTPPMVEYMSLAQVGDDVYGEDTTVNVLQDEICKMSGKDAGIFLVSGTMSNQIAIQSHLSNPPYSVVCDANSHVFCYEASGISFHTGALVIPIKAESHFLTAKEIEEKLVLDDDIHHAPTKLICLENTLNGTILPFQELLEISTIAKKHKIPIHLDGARLWNASIATGLGAPIGSILIGDNKFIKRAKHLRKLYGGGWRQAGYLANACMYSLDKILPNLERDHKLAQILKNGLLDLGFPIIYPVETNMVWTDASILGDPDELIEMLKCNGIIVSRPDPIWRLVIHHQISEENEQESLNSQANNLYKSGDYKLAIEFYTKSIDLTPEAKSFWNRSAAYFMLKDYEKSLKDTLTAITMHDLEKYYARALKCYLALGNINGAIQFLQNSETFKWEKELNNLQQIQKLLKSASDESSSPDVRLLAIENCFLLIDPTLKVGPWVPNRSKLGEQDFSLIYSNWQCLRARCLEETGNLASAFNVTFHVLSKEPNHVEAMTLRAKYLYILDKQPVESIISILSKTLSLDPDNKEAFKLLKGIKKANNIKLEGNQFFSQRKWNESIEKYTEFLKLIKEMGDSFAIGVQYIKVLSNRANVYSKIQEYKEAIADVSNAIALLNGLNFADSFKDTNASLDFESSVHSELYYKLFLRRADSLMKTEEFEDAVRDYKVVAKMRPSDREIQRAVRDAEKALKLSLRKDYYKILGVERTASEYEIKKSYRKMALQFHPDKQAGLSEEERVTAEVKFKEIGEAYTVLSDEKKRRMFDSGMDINGMSDSGFDGYNGFGGGGMPMDDLLRAFMSQQGRGSGGGFHSFHSSPFSHDDEW